MGVPQDVYAKSFVLRSILKNIVVSTSLKAKYPDYLVPDSARFNHHVIACRTTGVSILLKTVLLPQD